MLICSKCKLNKDRSKFNIRSDVKRGYSSWCKDCISMRRNNRPHLGKNGEFKLKSIEIANNKLCTECNIMMDKSKFAIKKGNNLRSKCLECESLIRKSKVYNISIESLKRMMFDQENLCKICNLPQPDNRELYVDHDHLTGKVRALLCRDCNTALGLLKDNPVLLDKASEYLKYHHSKR